uniref:SFRICE_019131 n=1 Tax=Spodoptera frugiperda TaxID=7108 RepID=A0A2H1VSS6_SPOFR
MLQLSVRLYYSTVWVCVCERIKQIEQIEIKRQILVYNDMTFDSALVLDLGPAFDLRYALLVPRLLFELK